MSRFSLSASVLLLSLAFSSAAAAGVSVFLSQDSTDPGAPVLLDSNASVTLHLYVESQGDPTTTGLQVCENGDGSELCGYDLTLEALAGTVLASFTPVADAVYSLTPPGSPTRLRLNAVEAVSGVAGLVYVGDLTVDTTSGQGITLSTAKVLDASLNLVSLGSKPLAVPEPPFLSALASGIAGLALLGRFRQRRAQ